MQKFFRVKKSVMEFDRHNFLKMENENLNQKR